MKRKNYTIKKNSLFSELSNLEQNMTDATFILGNTIYNMHGEEVKTLKGREEKRHSLKQINELLKPLGFKMKRHNLSYNFFTLYGPEVPTIYINPPTIKEAQITNLTKNFLTYGIWGLLQHTTTVNIHS